MELTTAKLTLKISVKDGEKEIVRNVKEVSMFWANKEEDYSLDYLLSATTPYLEYFLGELIKEAVEVGINTSTLLEIKGYIDKDATPPIALTIKQSLGDIGCKLVYLAKVRALQFPHPIPPVLPSIQPGASGYRQSPYLNPGRIVPPSEGQSQEYNPIPVHY